MADSDDEDILYDNDLGRNLIGGKRVKNVDDVLNGGKKDKRKLRKTLALCMAFLCLGLCLAILGPTLLSLQKHLHTTLPKISWVFAGRSVGYLSGAILGGMLFESFNPLFLLAVVLLLCGIGVVIAPYMMTVMGLGVCISSVGVSMGVLDTGANLICLRMWGKKRSGTMLQALHFSFAVGAFIAPLVASPFLVETNSPIMANNTTSVLPVNNSTTAIPLINTAPEGNQTDTPEKGNHTDALDKGNHTYTPQKGNHTDTPEKGNHTDTPEKGNHTDTPEKRNHTDTPEKGNHTDTPEKGNHTDTPEKGNHTDTPEKGNHTDTPEEGNHTDTPKKGNHTDQIVPSEEKNTHKPTKKEIKKNTRKKREENENQNDTPFEGDQNDIPGERNQDDTPDEGNKDEYTNSEQPAPQRHVERFAFAYIIIGVMVLLTSVLFFYFLCTKPKDEPQYIGSENVNKMSNMNNFPFRTRIIVLLFFFYFLYVGGEVAYGSFVSMFAIKSKHHFEEDRASHVAALFWGAFSLGRGLAICLASVISPLKMVITDMVGCVSTSVALTLFADSNENILWICSALLGLSMASLFPSGIAWLESYTPVTGNTASFLIVGSALGEMCVPLIIGYLFEDILGPMVLMYWMLATSALSSLIFVYVMWLMASNGQEKESLPAEKSPALELFHSVEEALPMEEIFKNGGSDNKQLRKPPILKRKDHRE